MIYNSPKPSDILEEDKLVERWPVKLMSKDIAVLPVTQIFQ